MSTTRAAAYCKHCGTRLDGSFCSGCGAPAADTLGIQDTAEQPTVALPRQGGRFQREDSTAPSAAGFTASAAQGAPTAPPPAYGAAVSRQVGRGRWWALLGVGLALIVAAGVCLALGVFSSKGQTYDSKLSDAFAPLVGQNRTLSNSLVGLPGSKTAAVAAVSAAQQQTAATRTTLATLGAGHETEAAAAGAALDAESTYLATVKAVLKTPAAPGASQLSGLENSLQDRLTAVGALAGAGASVSGADKLVAWAAHSTKASGTRKDLRGFASSVDSVLQRSAPSRQEISQTFTQMQNDEITINDAESSLGDVISNRSGLAGAARALPAPTGLAGHVRDALAKAFDDSLADDRAIQNCLNEGIDTNLEVLYQDCLSSTASEAGAATNSKQQFTGLYNKLRHKLGLPDSNVVF